MDVWLKTLYPFLWHLGRSFVDAFFELRIIDKHNIPTKGGAIIVANHQSHLDPIMVSAISRRPVRYIARRTLATNPFMKVVFKVFGVVPINRESSDLEAFSKGVELLKKGEIVGIFPEGTRSPNGKLGEFKKGSILLAKRANVPIIPVGIYGTFFCWPKHERLPKKGKVVVSVGNLINVKEIIKKNLDLRKEVYNLIEKGKKILKG